MLADLDFSTPEFMAESVTPWIASSGSVGHLYVHRLSAKDQMVDLAVALKGNARSLVYLLLDTGADVGAILLAVFSINILTHYFLVTCNFSQLPLVSHHSATINLVFSRFVL